ncbi:nucleoside kinase [Candidatus Phytoplasma pruni]|uniref:Nucleoside kinase n=1 Tax=Candidatus Phytoplasma pruni TaxID=479893 RepID=A0A851HAS6_9MOLU|nr:nucleoside kinase [Candidatus Phytoplasma pruni]NWN46062.1 nucleoside kinase [Candidatus Phytoplasma pruni]
MLKVYYKNQTLNVDSNTTLEELKNRLELTDVYGAQVNNKIRELTFELTEPENEVLFLDLTHPQAVDIYEASLRYLVAMAFYHVFPEKKVRFSYYSSQSLLVRFENDAELTLEMFEKIQEKMQDLVAQKLKIEKKSFSLEKALEIYNTFGYDNKSKLLQQKPQKTVPLYVCGSYYNDMHQGMVPNTSYLTHYQLLYRSSSMILQFPQTFHQGKIPLFKEEHVFEKTLHQTSVWRQTAQTQNLHQINNYSLNPKKNFDLISIAEINHQRQLMEISRQIADKKNQIKIIHIAGPSSSGKTTLAKKLQLQLLAVGITSTLVSMDNYYLPLAEVPKTSDCATYDFEHIQALNIALFNQNINDLILHKKAIIPQFDFSTRVITHKPIEIDTQVLLVEGIHANNPALLPSLAREQKFKIYIAPQHQLSLDEHNPLHITDIRFLRRTIRDLKMRSTNILKTFDFWKSVREGEFRWIYPYQQEADYVFNSELIYEFNVLKPYLEPLLLEVPSMSPYFEKAQYYLKLLSWFDAWESDLVPHDSLLREFIGNSPFYQ